MKFISIILAAGKGKRINKIKPLLLVKNKTFLELLYEKFYHLCSKNVFFVIGYHKKKILNYFNNKYYFIINPKPQNGQFSSLKYGLKFILNKNFVFDYIFIHLIDIPLIKKETLIKMKKCIEKFKPEILIPSYNYRKGHPVVISKDIAKYIIKYKNPDKGLRTIFKQLEKNINYINIDDKNILIDIDTLKDYNSILDRKV